MNLERLYKLIDAGFTRDEIMRLAGYDKTPATAPAPATAPEPTPAPAPAPEPAPNPFAETLKEINATLKQMQMANIGASNNQPPRNDDDVANDFLAAIINPPTNNKED